MFNTYQEALAYLYDSLPMYQRIGAAAFKKDLTNIIALCNALNNPQQKFKTVHVGGTNGKGSTSHMLASILQSSGYKTGLYTSPHLKSFTERIRVNGLEIPEQFIIDFVNRIHTQIEQIKPSFFEITVAMAFEYFVSEKVDVALIEVGLGGRLDSTNIITPELSLITNIGWDHKDILGDTLEEIAFEKAGIIKPNTPVVISERQSSIEKVFRDKASVEQASIFFATDQYLINQREETGQNFLDVMRGDKLIFQNLLLPLQGNYQKKNLGGVLKAVDCLKDQGWSITNNSIVEGLSKVIVQTGLKGRWQQLSSKPLIICDTAHNEDGVREVVKQIHAQSYKKLHIVWGSVKDKDLSAILQLLPSTAQYYFCQAKIPRAMCAEDLSALAKNYSLKGDVIADVNEALSQAKSNASADDMIFVGGSTFVVAEINNL